MAACYFLLNHSAAHYVSLGARCLGQGTSYFHTRFGPQARRTDDADLAAYLLEHCGDALEFATDTTHDLDFLDTYAEALLGRVDPEAERPLPQPAP